jgi:hypothetical protein
MKNRKVVTAPVQDGPVKAKPGPIEPPEQGTGPRPVDVPPPGQQGPGESAAQIKAKPCR